MSQTHPAKRILVTGGSGFIGSHLVDQLLERGCEVKIYDLDTPRYGQACQFVRADTLDFQRLVKESAGIDVIYHLAAEANVNRFYESPLYSNAITSSATLCVLEAARVNRVGRVILASTEWVYGTAPGSPEEVVGEDAPYAQDPDHLYTSSKIAAELFCLNYRRLYDVNFTILRYGIPFGERARRETVTPVFLERMLQDREITIHGDGSQFRQFVYVRDLAAGNVAALSAKAENEIFNLNGTQKITVLQIVRTLEDILGRKARLRFVNDRAGNYGGRFISSAKAKHVLDWEPRVVYKEALAQYVEWFRAKETW